VRTHSVWQAMASGSSLDKKGNLRSGTVYKRTGKFLANNGTLDPEPKRIESRNTVSNPYSNKRKRRYIDLMGDALCRSLSDTAAGRCFNKLRKLEQEVDVSMTKRHNLIANQLQKNQSLFEHSVTRVLRLECFNTFHPDPVDSAQSKWSLKVQTKLFDPKDMDHALGADDRGMEWLYHHPLTAVISRIEVVVDPDGVGDVVEWNNAFWSHHSPQKALSESLGALADGLEITRNGSSHCDVDLFVHLTNWFIPFEHDAHSAATKKRKSAVHSDRNALCKVSAALGGLLALGLLSDSTSNSERGAVRYHSKGDILQCLGHYCSAHRLIRRDHSMAIDCDAALEAVLGAKTVYTANLWKLLVLRKHVLPPEPIRIRHQIRVSGAITENAKIYDITVKVPSLTAMRASKLMEPSHDRHAVDRPNGMQMTIDALNVQISDVLEEIDDQRKERALYSEYAKDAVSAIDVMVSNQRENLLIINEFAQNARPKPSPYFANSSIYGDIRQYLQNRQLLEERARRQNDTQ